MHPSILMATLLMFLATSPSFADRRSEPLTSHAVISHGDAHRILFKAEGFRTLRSVAIRRAVIEFDVAGQTVGRALRLSLCPVTSSWNAASASWSEGWRRPGGDFDEDLAAETLVDLSRDGKKAIFDVTPILKEWVESGAEYHGFILTVQRRVREDGIRAEDLARLQGLEEASLIVDYRKVPPRPPARRSRG